jgi:glycosyltransferase involved in cell wall biosynthesis
VTKVSACIICFDEEPNIRACLESVRFCDEIVVVDSGSRDRTREIAREFTDRVVERAWPGHIEQKNFAIDAAKNDWVFSIDADERVTDELRRSIEAVLAEDPPRSPGYELARRTWHLGRFIRRGGWYPDRKVRLFDRRRGRWGGVNPHDHVQLDGRPGRLAGDLLHYSYRDLRHQIDTVNSFTSIAAKELLRKQERVEGAGPEGQLLRKQERVGEAQGPEGPESAKRGRVAALPRMLLHPPAAFFRSYVLKLGFLEGVPGLILAVVAAFYSFAKYAKLWEARHARPRGDAER